MAENTKRWAEISKRYRTWIKIEKRLSPNTVEAYMHDLLQFAHYILRMWDVAPAKVEPVMIERYMSWLYDRGREATSQARNLSGVKSFFNFLLLEELIPSSPAEFIETPKFGRQLPDLLTTDEIDRIIAAIDTSTVKGRRDSAMLEVLYSCGLRVSELTSLRTSDLFFGEGYIRVVGKGDKQRLVPISRTARDKIQIYLDDRRTNEDRERRADPPARFANPLPQQPGQGAHPRDGLHHHPAGGTPSRDRQAGQPPHLPPQLRHPPARRGRLDPSGAGAAGAREHPHDRDLHPPRRPPSAGDPRKVPAAGLTLRYSSGCKFETSSRNSPRRRSEHS